MGLPSRKPHAISRSQERRFAATTGGKVQPGSGAPWNKKGDIDLPPFLGECKTTLRGTHRIHYSVLKKISEEAHKKGRIPFLSFGFYGNSNPEWVAITFADFVEYMRLLKEEGKV